MSFPRPLARDADVGQLAAWLTEWSLLYPVDYDAPVTAIARPTSGFGVTELKTILDWKLERRFRDRAKRQVDAYDLKNPDSPTSTTSIRKMTASAIAAANDIAARKALSGLAWAQGPAVGSAVLTIGNPDRWTVYDVMACCALRQVRDTLSGQVRRRNAPLQPLARQLAKFQNDDWYVYLDCCRAIRDLTLLSLRAIDRALYEARGR